MKNNLMRFCGCMLAIGGFVLTVSFTSASSSATVRTAAADAKQAAAPVYKELILQIYETNDKNMADIRSAMEGGGGVFFKGYCESLSLFLYVVNTDVNPDMTFLDKLKTRGYDYLIKEGSTIEQVQAACGMDATSNNNSTETE